MIYTVKGYSIVSEAEVDVFLEFPCFLYNPVNVGSLISCSSSVSKPSLYIWKFSVYILLKPSLKDFEHNLPFGHLHSYSGIWKLRCRQTFFYGIVFSVVLRLIPGWMLTTFLMVFFFLSVLLIRDHVHFIPPGPGVAPSTLQVRRAPGTHFTCWQGYAQNLSS